VELIKRAHLVQQKQIERTNIITIVTVHLKQHSPSLHKSVLKIVDFPLYQYTTTVTKNQEAYASTLRKLCESQNRKSIPFHYSTITQILHSTLLGNCYTSILLYICPYKSYMQATVNSLRLAETAGKIKMNPTKNST